VANNRWRAVVVIEGPPETSPNDFGKMWHAFRNEIDKGVDFALIEGSTGGSEAILMSIERNSFFALIRLKTLTRRQPKLFGSAAQASSLPDDCPMIAPSYIVAPSVYEWPDGLPLA